MIRSILRDGSSARETIVILFDFLKPIKSPNTMNHNSYDDDDGNNIICEKVLIQLLKNKFQSQQDGFLKWLTERDEFISQVRKQHENNSKWNYNLPIEFSRDKHAFLETCHINFYTTTTCNMEELILEGLKRSEKAILYAD